MHSSDGGYWWTLAIYMQTGGRDIPRGGISRLTSSSHDTMYLCASLFSPWDGGCAALRGILRAYDDFLHLLCSSGFFKILPYWVSLMCYVSAPQPGMGW